VCRVASCRWLSYWSDNESKNSVWFYLGIYAAIGGGNTLFVLIRSILFAYGGLNSAKSLHEKLLHRVPAGTSCIISESPLRLICTFIRSCARRWRSSTRRP
jgi:hypothetical protein